MKPDDEQVNKQVDKQVEVHDEEWADKKFPDLGNTPSNKVIVDEDVEPSPNISHPH